MTKTLTKSQGREDPGSLEPGIGGTRGEAGRVGQRHRHANRAEQVRREKRFSQEEKRFVI